MILKIVKTGLFVLCIILLFFACKKDKLENLQEDVLGEYEYFTCFTGPQRISDTSDLRWMTTCDSSKRIMIISKSDSINSINIYMGSKTKVYKLNPDSTFTYRPESRESELGKFYKKDSIKIRINSSSASHYYYELFGKKVK